jgi:hypothetical protein
MSDQKPELIADYVAPIRNVALCIELGERPILALMTKADWNLRVRQELAPWMVSE